jgi:hypothetical protein
MNTVEVEAVAGCNNVGNWYHIINPCVKPLLLQCATHSVSQWSVTTPLYMSSLQADNGVEAAQASGVWKVNHWLPTFRLMNGNSTTNSTSTFGMFVARCPATRDAVAVVAAIKAARTSELITLQPHPTHDLTA